MFFLLHLMCSLSCQTGNSPKSRLLYLWPLILVCSPLKNICKFHVKAAAQPFITLTICLFACLHLHVWGGVVVLIWYAVHGWDAFLSIILLQQLARPFLSSSLKETLHSADDICCISPKLSNFLFCILVSGQYFSCFFTFLASRDPP